MKIILLLIFLTSCASINGRYQGVILKEYPLNGVLDYHETYIDKETINLNNINSKNSSIEIKDLPHTIEVDNIISSEDLEINKIHIINKDNADFDQYLNKTKKLIKSLDTKLFESENQEEFEKIQGLQSLTITLYEICKKSDLLLNLELKKYPTSLNYCLTKK